MLGGAGMGTGAGAGTASACARAAKWSSRSFMVLQPMAKGKINFCLARKGKNLNEARTDEMSILFYMDYQWVL